MNRTSQTWLKRLEVSRPRPVRLRLVGLVALGFCGACLRQEADKPSLTVVTSARYVHQETTGITDVLILPDGTRQPIFFAPGSRGEELGALEAVLACGIFGSVPGASGEVDQPLTVEGELHGQVLRTPTGPDRAEPEDYREFALHRWSLAVPFVARAGFGTSCEVTALPGQTSLRRACPSITGHGDLDRFVRVR